MCCLFDSFDVIRSVVAMVIMPSDGLCCFVCSCVDDVASVAVDGGALISCGIRAVPSVHLGSILGLAWPTAVDP